MPKSPRKIQDQAGFIASQISEYKRGRRERGEESEFDVRDFIENHCKILTEQGEVLSPIMRPAQEKVHEACERQLEERGMVRLLVGKFRKPGVSTYVELRFLCHVINNPNLTVVVIAHRDDSARWIGRIPVRAYANLSSKIKSRAPTKREDPGERGLSFAPPHQGTYLVTTAGGYEFGHGLTPQRVHLSEVAWFPPNTTFLVGLGNALREIPQTEIIQETTFNGKDRFFYPEWKAAKESDGVSDYEALFLGLMEEERAFPFYSIPLREDEKLKLSPDERALQHKYDVPDPLMKFVVKKKNSAACLFRWDLFHQQFPLNEELALTTSATDIFPGDVLDDMETEHVRDPEFRADLRFAAQTVGSAVLLDTDADVPLFEAWEKGDPDAYYIVTFDVAEGFGGDYHVVNGWRIDEGEDKTVLVQAWHYFTNIIPHVTAGVHVFMLGTYLNTAFIIVEANNHGGAVLSHLLTSFDPQQWPQTIGGYPSLYYSRRPGKRPDKSQETDRAGWLTGPKTKKQMIDDLVAAVVNGNIIVRSKRTIDELRGFFWDPLVQDYGQSHLAEDGSHHDDEVMSAALAPQALDAWKRLRPVLSGMREDEF
jgi:hypothetical protein